MKINTEQKIKSTFLITGALAFALAFAACEIEPEVDTTQPSNSLLKEKTAYIDSNGETIDDYISDRSNKKGLAAFPSTITAGSTQTYPIKTLKPISLDALKSALKWSTLQDPIIADNNISPPYEYLAQDSLQPDIIQESENNFLLSFSNIPAIESNVIELHIVAAYLVTAAGGKIDTNNNGIPGQAEDDVYKNINVTNYTTTSPISGGNERQWAILQDISNNTALTGSIGPYEGTSEDVMEISVTVNPSETAFDNVIGNIAIEQSDDGVNWGPGPDMPNLTEVTAYYTTTEKGQTLSPLGKFYRLVANNAWDLTTGDTKIYGFTQHYYKKSDAKKAVLFTNYTVGAHLSTDLASASISPSYGYDSNYKNGWVKLNLSGYDEGFVAGADGHPENFRVLNTVVMSGGATTNEIPITAAQVFSEDNGTNNVVVLTLDPAYKVPIYTNILTAYIGPDVAVKNTGDPAKYFGSNNAATPNVPAFFLKVSTFVPVPVN